MKAPSFEKWFAQLSTLNQPQGRQTLAALHPAAGLDQDSKPVRAAAKQVEVHRNTTFRWRHRFLERVKHDRLDYLGWRWHSMDGGRVTSAEKLLRIAIGVIHRQR